MSSFVWPNDDGWPYPDGDDDQSDPESGFDDDVLAIRATPPHLMSGLDPLEREVVTAHYGLGGTSARSMKQIHHDTGLSRAELRHALAGGLSKLRHQLID